MVAANFFALSGHLTTRALAQTNNGELIIALNNLCRSTNVLQNNYTARYVLTQVKVKTNIET